MRRLAAVVAAVLLTTACQADEPTGADPSTAPATPAASPTATAAATPDDPTTDVPALAEAPGGDTSLWLDTIGVPVVAAVRTSTQLAQLADVPAAERAATCRQVAADLDGIGAPELLAGLAITADAETATLLVGDLRAKGDLLAACLDGGGELDARIAEVEHTHAVAVAWLALLRGDG